MTRVGRFTMWVILALLTIIVLYFAARGAAPLGSPAGR
jgi:hypothetical protein